MNTTILQVKKTRPEENSTFLSMILVAEERKNAIKGILDLTQLEKSYAFPIPQIRSINDPNTSVELFRYVTDDPILEKMEQSSVELSNVCDRGRGVELNKAGTIIQCPSCGRWLPPPASIKNTPKEEWQKKCSFCKHIFKWREALDTQTIVSDDINEYDVLYVDGDSIEGRYKKLRYKSLKLGYDGINYKEDELYNEPKIFIRQAGVGISASYDETGAYCPQSVYVYRIKEEYNEINHKFLLAVLQSRTMAYYVFKKFGEIDAAQAFSKLTHVRLAKLPIPVRHREQNSDWQSIHDQIVEYVDNMLNEGELGGSIDWQLERLIQGLYNLDSGDNAYIMSQLGLTAYHKSMREMFPHSPPPKPVTIEKITMIE